MGQVEFDDMGQVRGVTSEGETAKTKKVVCDPSYLPNKVGDVNGFGMLLVFVCWLEWCIFF